MAASEPAKRTEAQALAAFSAMAIWEELHCAERATAKRILDRMGHLCSALAYSTIDEDVSSDSIAAMRAEYFQLRRRHDRIRALLDASFVAWMSSAGHQERS